MWGVQRGPPPKLTFLRIYDGLDVTVTSDSTWFHPSHDMVSCRIYRLSIYGEHSMTTTTPAANRDIAPIVI